MEKINPAITIESMKFRSSPPEFPPIADDQIRVVGKGEYKEAALCLAKAFKDDDVAMYFIETGDVAHWTRERKWNLHLSLFEYLVYGHILKGLVTTIGPNYDCVALWMPPGQNMEDWLTCFRSGMWRLQFGFKFSAEGHKRYFREFMPLLHETKHEVLGDCENESWYLVYIGTKPLARGKGYARALIESVTKEADAENRYCYLESSNGINPKIYRKLGFENTKTIHLTRAAKPVELDIMVRTPVKSAVSKSPQPNVQSLSE